MPPLIARRDIAIEAATGNHNETHRKANASGVFSTGGVGFTLGSRKNSSDQDRCHAAAKSTVGSTEGNVPLLAQVDIVEARETSRTVTETRAKQSGLTIAITSPVITAIQTAQQMSEAAKDTSDPRMKALAAASTGLAGYNATAGQHHRRQANQCPLPTTPAR
ncbi:MAG: hypothetical protein IPO00_09250 [Betaproteobacteria bacterium]|nr:hypothetical protein [Betaproteobacteria bacterium]